MSTTESAPESTRAPRPALLVLVLAVVVAVAAVGALALDRWGPGHMGRGFAVGAAVGTALAGVAVWRALRHPDRATVGDRVMAHRADERDQRVADSALAVVGVAAVLLTAGAACAVALGVPADATLTVLLLAELAVGALAFRRAARRY